MAKRLMQYDNRLDMIRDHVIVVDDFTWFVTAHNWTSVLTNSGSATVVDGANGILPLVPSDGTVTDNDEAYIASTIEVFKVASGRTIVGECRLQFTEGATDDVNVFFGFQNAIAADSILDDGAGMKVSGDCFAIYKVDGGTKWKCVSCVNALSTVSQSSHTAGGSSYQTLRIEIADVDGGTTWEATFFLDGKQMLDDTTHRPIKHTGLTASATEMDLGAGIKNGADTTVEQLNIDYIYAAQNRA